MKTLKEFLHKKPQIEIDNLESSNELNKATLRRLKYETLRSIIFLFIGSALTIISTKLSSQNEQDKIILDNKKLVELNQLIELNQIHLKKLQLEVNALKKQVNK